MTVPQIRTQYYFRTERSDLPEGALAGHAGRHEGVRARDPGQEFTEVVVGAGSDVGDAGNLDPRAAHLLPQVYLGLHGNSD